MIYSIFKPRPIKGVDYHQETIKQYVSVPPYTKNKDGSFLNDTPYYKLVRVADKNVQEYIQSFKDETDLSTIIKRLTINGQMPTLQDFINNNTFGDVSNFDRNAVDPVKALNDQVKALQNEVLQTKEKLKAANNDELAKKIVKAINDTFGITDPDVNPGSNEKEVKTNE